MAHAPPPPRPRCNPPVHACAGGFKKLLCFERLVLANKGPSPAYHGLTPAFTDPHVVAEHKQPFLEQYYAVARQQHPELQVSSRAFSLHHEPVGHGRSGTGGGVYEGRDTLE